MTRYFDTGILIKLYSEEPESRVVAEFVTRYAEPLFLSGLHRSECVSAIRLKVFRGECEPDQADLAVAAIDEDFRAEVLKVLPVDWEEVWAQCYRLSAGHAAVTGCRTLDALHVACAVLSPADEFVSSDRRQLELARRAGLRVTNPCG